tara:strand:- start:401 stop:604 length:204 start_codon:yes stop_codon:yes gene_type:complete
MSNITNGLKSSAPKSHLGLVLIQLLNEDTAWEILSHYKTRENAVAQGNGLLWDAAIFVEAAEYTKRQ